MHHTSTEKPMQCRAVIMLLRLLYQISGKYAMRSLRLLGSCADGAPVRRAPLRGERQRGASAPLDTRDALHRLYRLRAGEQAADAGPFIS